MFKNKFKIIALLTVIIMSLMIPMVYAVNSDDPQAPETSDEKAIQLTSEEEPEEDNNNNSQADDNMKKGDVYLTGEDVTIDYVVDGNVYVLADTVTIKSQIGGDAFICAGTINIEEEGYIYSNLFALTEKLNISGIVYDLYTFAQEVNVKGYIYRDIRVGADTLNIDGKIGRNAFVEANSINFMSQNNSETEGSATQGIVNGDFNYSSSKEVQIPEGAVAGKVNFEKAKADKEKKDMISDYLFSVLGFVATVIIIWLICLWRAPKFLENSLELIKNKMLPVIGYGILTPIVASIAIVILMMLGITLKIAFIALGLLIIAFAISKVIFIIAINNLICEKLKIEKNFPKFYILALSAIVFCLIALIPYIGGLVKLVAGIIGIGILFINLIPLGKKEKVTE